MKYEIVYEPTVVHHEGSGRKWQELKPGIVSGPGSNTMFGNGMELHAVENVKRMSTRKLYLK